MTKKENIKWWIYVVLNYLFLGFILYFEIYPLIIPMFIITLCLTFYGIKKMNKHENK